MPEQREVAEPPDESERKRVEEKLPKIGEKPEEKMTVAGVELTPSSTVKELKACKFLGIGVTGSKAVIWQRLKKEAATSKLKETVEISKAIKREFQREPKGEKLPAPPSEEELKVVLLQEVEKLTSKCQKRSTKHLW